MRDEHAHGRPPKQLRVGATRYAVSGRVVPFLRLMGVWLDDIGLSVGTRVEVQRDNGVLRLIRALDGHPPEPR